MIPCDLSAATSDTAAAAMLAGKNSRLLVQYSAMRSDINMLFIVTVHDEQTTRRRCIRSAVPNPRQYGTDVFVIKH